MWGRPPSAVQSSKARQQLHETPQHSAVIPKTRAFTSATALLTSPFDSSSSIPTCPPYRLEIEPPRMVAILRELIGEDRCHSFSKRRQGGQ